MTSTLCDTTAAGTTVGGSFVVRRKQGGSEVTLPERQLPLSLQFRNSFLLGKGRIQGLLRLLLDTSVLSSSAALR